ncbi:MAG TPA: hypothetical protein VGE06_06050 [Flavisolibacter sp.]
MKTKILLFLSSLFLGFQMSAHKNSNPANGLNLRSQVQQRVNSEVYKWDFSSLKNQHSKAFVSFKINEKGQPQITDIACDDEALQQLIASKLPLCYLGDHEPQTVYQVCISYKRI